MKRTKDDIAVESGSQDPKKVRVEEEVEEVDVVPKSNVVSPWNSSDVVEVVSESRAKSTHKHEEDVEAEKDDTQMKLPDFQRDIAEHNVQCSHEVCLPDNFDVLDEKMFNPPEPKVYVKEYPFKLDPFQVSAVACIHRNESVLVSAHTSAGKTAVAEYAIAQAVQQETRVLYTSPIKALSNQKFREMSEVYGEDVGLITGDVTIRPEATIIVLTTEILRSMLYRGSEMIREVSWVIFDEVHYLRDKERGVVWEETLILLPSTIRFVFLSATIPNASEFASWVADLHKQPCHVVYTDYRPTPLQHYMFPQGGDGVFLICDERGNFREENYQKAIAALHSDKIIGGGKPGDKRSSSLSSSSSSSRRKKPGAQPNDVQKLVRMIVDRNYEPAIVFAFSKRECESLALALLGSNLDFNSKEEKELVGTIYDNAIQSLSEQDRKLPAVSSILNLCKRGIGIHHGGLLPILKELIEILFQESLLKVLFATETFSMGLNMPARTVVFTGMRKFDGKDFRVVSSGEYIQMSGRAGRRGIDSRGIVIIMLDDKIESPSLILKGEPDALKSAFHLSYNMLLNLSLVEGVGAEHMLMHSFHQFQNDRQIPEMKKNLSRLERELEGMVFENESNIRSIFKIRYQIEKARVRMKNFMRVPLYCLPFLQPGRLLRIKTSDQDYGWGAVVSFEQIGNNAAAGNRKAATAYTLDIVLNVVSTAGAGSAAPLASTSTAEWKIVPVSLSCVDEWSAVRLHVPKQLRSRGSLAALGNSIEGTMKKFPNGLPMLDPIEDMNIRDKEFKSLLKRIVSLDERLLETPGALDKEITTEVERYRQKVVLETEIKKLQRNFRDSHSLMLSEELRCMMRVMRKLGFTDENNVITHKGRVACEINTVDELLMTELIVNDLFSGLDVPETVALLSAFVWEEKSDPKNTLAIAAELQDPLMVMKETARKIARVSVECKIPINEEDYVNSLKPELMDVVYQWCKGKNFLEICRMTDVFEGSIVRTFHRLEELLRELQAASKAIGNGELEAKFIEAIAVLKRDIAFCPSLYL